jgi:fatty-acyl-CoA synthase
MSSAQNPFSSNWVKSGRQDPRSPQNGLSYVAGSGEDPLRFRTIPQHLDRAVARFGPRDAVFFAATHQRLSWYDLQAQSNELAAGLLALGIDRSDRVGIWAPNRLEWVLTQFGTARIGAIMVNINPAYKLTELEYALNKVQCKVLITARSLKTSDYIAMLRNLALAGKLPHLQKVVILDGAPGGDDRS